ncbi:nudix family protein [Lichtheimia corymbifera JMRC:FSU:9682]|uniref:Nudix family protein n=1 Tax=Lichtheimia corymbifera JMRC:FSU:9682 TaxID=1263082 RepID=A0A068RNU1_9FUNG|nr:nudix family protein [Lichtheimia corymbifera JMRC:FSU:9682]
MAAVTTGRSIKSRLARYAPFECTADLSNLSKQEHTAIKHLVKAGRFIDQLYFRQHWSGNEALRKKIHEQGDRDLCELFEMYKGPWASEDNDEPFVEGVPPCPETGNFYPEDMTKHEFEEWTSTLSKDEETKAKSFYTRIVRGADNKLAYVPYSECYKDLLEPAAKHFRDAADALSELPASDIKDGKTSVETFLRSRAEAFASNDYLPSELDWLSLSKYNKLEVTAGPYEVYTDAMFGLKSAYEFYIHARDEESSRLLEAFSDLQFVEDHLPIPDKYRNDKLIPAPIAVVNQLYAAGDVGVPMTAAYNLPNDEEAIKKGGSKLVLIKNVQEGKFAHVLTPIAKQVIAADQLEYITSDAFTTHILLHEVCHSNGPHHTLAGDTVRSKLKEYHSAMEEAKADIAGLFAATLLIKKGKIDKVTDKQFWVTFLASAFRSIRFGIKEAHGLGQACQLNYLVEKGGFVCDSENRYRVDFDKVEQAVSDLTHDIMILQGDGDKSAVDAFIGKYGVLSEETKVALERIEHAAIPVDIRPIYPIADNEQ